VDPITAGILTATLVPLANGVAGEAGKQAWGSLVTFVRNRFGRGSEADTAALALAGTPEEVAHGELLGRVLERGAAEDEQVAAWLRAWLGEAAPLAGQPWGQPAVTNTISGNAQVQGPVVQAHTISGPITFGSPAPPQPPTGA
jgi:hypothetical protein